MSTTKRTKLLVAALLAVAGQATFAVDPLLHDDPAFLLQAPGSPLLGIEPAESTAGVEVRDIRDLGPKPPAEATPGDLWIRIRAGFAIPDLVSPVVVQRQAWYAQRPEQLRIFVDRSRKYLFHIVEALERRGMPTELALLPMVESAYNPMAYSRAHASGLWQFIPSTGRNYNLDQNFWYDGRRDILASTNAALDYLQSLYEMFGDWHLALAAYNMGENGVQRAIDRNKAQRKPADYQSISMPRETRAYVPSLQALKNIVANPGAAGVQLDPIPNAPYFVTVTLTRDIDLRVAAKLAEMPVEELVALNPGHNRPLVAAGHSPQLILPTDRAEAFIQNLERHDKPLSSWQIHTFKAGDKLDKLAAEHGLSLERLRAINGLGPKGTVVVGQQLVLPQKGSVGRLRAAAVHALGRGADRELRGQAGRHVERHRRRVRRRDRRPEARERGCAARSRGAAGRRGAAEESRDDARETAGREEGPARPRPPDGQDRTGAARSARAGRASVLSFLRQSR